MSVSNKDDDEFIPEPTDSNEFSYSQYFSNLANQCGVSVAQLTIAISMVQLFLSCAYLLIYIFVLEPSTFLLIENHHIRWKVQGGLTRVLESMTAILYDHAFEIELIGFETVNPETFAIVTSNHQGLIDYLTIINSAGNAGLINSVFFFVWKHCVRVPSITVLYNQWLKRTNWRVPNMMLSQVFSPVSESPWKEAGGKWVVIFPEVTPWTVGYMLEHRATCVENGCPKLENSLYPRFSAFVQTVGFLRDYPVTDVYDSSIKYLNSRHQISVPTWYDLVMSQKDWKIRVEVSRTKVSTIPHKEKHVIKWLEKQWYEKDRAVTKFKSSLAKDSTTSKPAVTTK